MNQGIPDGPFTVGEFRVYADSNELDRGEGRVRVRPLLMQVLVRLAATPGAAVGREALINDVWARKMVNDEVLSRAIAELRTALGDDPKAPRYIETLPKVGYRLVAPVSVAAAADAPAAAPGPTPAAADHPTPPPRAGRPLLVLWLATIALATAVLAASHPREPGPPATDLAIRLAAAVPLASDPGLELSPRFSPDGRWVAYVRIQGATRELVIQPLPTGERRVLASAAEPMASPVWLPDGKAVVYWRVKDGACEIAAAALADGAVTRLMDCALNPLPRFDVSPDGRHLAVAVRERADYPSALALVTLAGGARSVLTKTTPGEGDDVMPRFSPDGRTIAFFRGSASHARVWTVDAEPPHAARPATAVEGLSYGIAWLGNDGPLLVAADWLGFRALNRLDLATGSATLLGARGARFPDATRDGRIAFESATFRADLVMTDAAAPGSARDTLWPSTRYSNQARFSPDGRAIAFASNREGGDGIYVGVPGEAAPRRLPFPEGYRYIRPHWSADGKSVYAVRIPAGVTRPTAQHGVKIDVASGRAEVLDALGDTVNAVQAAGDGSLIVGELAGYAMRLSRVMPGGGMKRLALPVVSEFLVVDDTLVYTVPQLEGATRCELATLRCAPLKVALDEANRFDWALSREAIWYRGRDAGGRRVLARYGLKDGSVREYPFVPTAAGSSVAVDREDKRLVLSIEADPVIDLMLAKP